MKPDQLDHKGRNPLMLAALQGDGTRFQELLDDFRLNYATQLDLFALDHDGNSILFYIAQHDDTDMLWSVLRLLPGTGLFCARGSLLNIRNKTGQLAEDTARTKGNLAVYEDLSRERVRIEYTE